MFKLRVDTGGTFTDCRGMAEGEISPRLVKVLSSGRLRVSVEKWISPTSPVIQIPPGWHVSDAFFTGFKLEASDASALVISFSQTTRQLHLSTPVTQTDTVDLFTREEAPVLGARLLTGTALDQEFPPLEFRLATTRGTNALLERKGAPVAFFVSVGFKDLLTIRDQRRPDLFALNHIRPEPLFAAVREIQGRLDADGSELAALILDAQFEQQAAALLKSGIRTAAVALLHSYRNPAHEVAVREKLLSIGFERVSISSELSPEIKLLPRAETAVANAYLQPIMEAFVSHVGERCNVDDSLLVMTSAGGLETASTFHPKDSLLSGPAGGVSGAAAVAEELGIEKVITFDMGGTSTDVARYNSGFHYQFEQTVGDARLLSPALKIETVASGGGSICQWSNGALQVGPESAGANPGPACYGRGGPLTITDVNLLLGRIDPSNFGIPLSDSNIDAARAAAFALQTEAGLDDAELNAAFLEGLIDIAVEQMADAIRTVSIRDGANASDYTLLAFGGAGPLHACDLAANLGIKQIVVPAEAGLLSAFGLDRASVERISTQQLNCPVSSADLAKSFAAVDERALRRLRESGFEGSITRRIVELRLSGQDATLQVDFTTVEELPGLFRTLYKETFGYEPTGEIEVTSYRAIAGTGRLTQEDNPTGLDDGLNPVEFSPASPFLNRSEVEKGQSVSGPIVIQDPFSTLYLPADWSATPAANGALIVTTQEPHQEAQNTRPVQIQRELFRHRFDNLVEEMGTMLQRSAISTNVKERADFSCALLDREGQLISSAPHIPVHLGALGMCVRLVSEATEMRDGDTIITNHPGVGGSHLPDVTLITPVYADARNEPVAYIANRAHHAEIGGITPGSMPPAGSSLAEEGVVISPMHLIRGGSSCFSEIESVLTHAPFPTRNPADNLADLNAQLAANRRGASALKELLTNYGANEILDQFDHLKSRSHALLQKHIESRGDFEAGAEERLDDGTVIRVHVKARNSRLHIDFNGTSGVHPGNLNATRAIIQSAILYVLRLWTGSDFPLNEGMLSAVKIVLPHCFLNPEFPEDPAQCPAVVGGNVETSQRVVDTLIKALGIQACSQGTMNNFLFGNADFGYYETICGGAGAGYGYDGASGIHTHMTNTAITDPEILEHRYPVRLHRFAILEGSGGNGKWRGGNGIIREVEFLAPLEVSLLTQHRKQSPFGIEGGEAGATGSQVLNGAPLGGITSFQANPADILTIKTPGGGGYGKPVSRDR